MKDLTDVAAKICFLDTSTAQTLSTVLVERPEPIPYLSTKQLLDSHTVQEYTVWGIPNTVAGAHQLLRKKLTVPVKVPVKQRNML